MIVTSSGRSWTRSCALDGVMRSRVVEPCSRAYTRRADRVGQPRQRHELVLGRARAASSPSRTPCSSRCLAASGPRPGTSSSTDVVIFLSRSWRWYVIAKRCASSRTCCSRYSASESRGMRTGSARPGQVHLLEPLGEAGDADVLEPSSSSTRTATSSWPLPPSISSRFGGYANRLPGVRAFVALAEVVAEPAGQHLLHRREVVLAVERLAP